MQWHGIEEQRVVNSGLPAIARDLKLPLVCTNDVHYLREADAHPHDVLLCIGTGKAFSDPKRLRYDAKQFFLKTPEEMAEVFKDFPDALVEHGAHRRALRRHARRGRELPAELRRARRRSRSTTTSSTWRARGSTSGCRGCSSSPATGALRHTIDEYERRLSYEIEMIKTDEVPGYFLIVWDFIRYAREQGIPVGPGPRVGGRQPGRLLPADHRRRSDRLRSDLRAVPQPRARVAARYRHRLLRAPPRRSDRVRHAEVRPRERRADHHLRDDEGEGRRARRRPRARDAVRRRRQGRQADPAGARHDARQGARGEPGAARSSSRTTRRSRSC